MQLFDAVSFGAFGQIRRELDEEEARIDRMERRLTQTRDQFDKGIRDGSLVVSFVNTYNF